MSLSPANCLDLDFGPRPVAMGPPSGLSHSVSICFSQANKCYDGDNIGYDGSSLRGTYPGPESPRKGSGNGCPS